MSAKLAFLYFAKWVGLFRLSRMVFRKHPIILCYHGTSFSDEHEFRPMLFIRPEVLDERFRWLKDQGYSVVSLQTMVEGLKNGRLPRHARVLTIDDGFFSTRALAAPILKKHGFPCTVYITTYYVEHPNPIFRLVVQYLFWKTSCKMVSFDGLAEGLAGGGRPTKGDEGETAMWELIELAETELGEWDRVELTRELGRRLDVDYEELETSRRLSLVTPGEISELKAFGLDVQLHTHRHRLPLEPELLKHEIKDNQRVLEPLVGKTLRHLCYPSGFFEKSQWPILESLGLKTGVTCVSGTVTRESPPMGLCRILDSDGFPLIVFESEVSGFKPLLRRILRKIRMRADVSAL